MIVRIVIFGIIFREMQMAIIKLPMPIISILDPSEGGTRDMLLRSFDFAGFKNNINKNEDIPKTSEILRGRSKPNKVNSNKPTLTSPSNVMKIQNIDCYSQIDSAKCDTPGKIAIRWGWSTAKRKCVSFWRGTCGGNDNHYNSRSDCDLYCNPQITTELQTTTTTTEPTTYDYSHLDCPQPDPPEDFFLIPRRRNQENAPKTNYHRNIEVASVPDHSKDSNDKIKSTRRDQDTSQDIPERRFYTDQFYADDNNMNSIYLNNRKFLNHFYPERQFQSYSADLDNYNTPEILSELRNFDFYNPQRRTLEMFLDSQSRFGDLQSFKGLTEAHIEPPDDFKKYAEDTRRPATPFANIPKTVDTNKQTVHKEPVIDKDIQTRIDNKIINKYISNPTEIVAGRKLNSQMKTLLDVLGINNEIKGSQITDAIVRNEVELHPDLFALIYRRLGATLAQANLTYENGSSPRINTGDSDYVSMETLEKLQKENAKNTKKQWDGVTTKVLNILKQNPSPKLTFAENNDSDLFIRRLTPNELKTNIYNHLDKRSKTVLKYTKPKEPLTVGVSRIKDKLKLPQYEEFHPVNERLSKTQLENIKSRIKQLFTQTLQEAKENQLHMQSRYQNSPRFVYSVSDSPVLNLESEQIIGHNENYLEKFQQKINPLSSKARTFNDVIPLKTTKKPDPADIDTRLNNVNQQLLRVQQMLVLLKQELLSLFGDKPRKKQEPQILRSKIPTPPPPKRPLNDLVKKYAILGLTNLMKYPFVMVYPQLSSLVYGVEPTMVPPVFTQGPTRSPIEYESEADNPDFYWYLRHNQFPSINQSVLYPRKNNILRTMSDSEPPSALQMHMNSMNEHLTRINEMLAPLKKEVVAFVHDLTLPLPMKQPELNQLSISADAASPYPSQQSYSDQAQSIPGSVHKFTAQSQSYSNPVQPFSESAQSVSDPEQSISESSQTISEPNLSYTNPVQSAPIQSYSEVQPVTESVPLRMDVEFLSKPVSVATELGSEASESTTTSTTTLWSKYRHHRHGGKYNSYVKKGAIKKHSKTRFE